MSKVYKDKLASLPKENFLVSAGFGWVSAPLRQLDSAPSLADTSSGPRPSSSSRR